MAVAEDEYDPLILEAIIVSDKVKSDFVAESEICSEVIIKLLVLASIIVVDLVMVKLEESINVVDESKPLVAAPIDKDDS